MLAFDEKARIRPFRNGRSQTKKGVSYIWSSGDPKSDGFWTPLFGFPYQISRENPKKLQNGVEKTGFLGFGTKSTSLEVEKPSLRQKSRGVSKSTSGMTYNIYSDGIGMLLALAPKAASIVGTIPQRIVLFDCRIVVVVENTSIGPERGLWHVMF